MYKVLAGFALLLCAGTGAAQPTIGPGNAAVNGASLEPYRNEWRVSLRDEGGKPLAETAVWSDELRMVRRDGADCWQRTQVATFSKDGTVVGKTETVNVFDRMTFAPLSRTFTKQSHLPGQQEETHVDFRGRSVHFRRTENGNTVDTKVDLPEAAFDFYGGMYGLLFAALPLQRGFSGEIVSVAESEPKPASVRFTVTGQERIQAGAHGEMTTWVIESNTALGPMKFWISKDAPYVIRLEYRQNDTGLTWTYVMS